MTISAGYSVDGTGTPVVLLHSTMSSKFQWHNLIQRLKDRYRVIAIDLYGYGDSPQVENPDNFTIDDEIRLMESVLEQTIGKEEEFHLVGHSYGGAIALRYSCRSDKRNISVTVFEPMANHVFRETNPVFFDKGKQLIDEAEREIAKGNLDISASRFVDYFNGEGTFFSLPAEIQGFLTGCVRKMPLDYKATINDAFKLADYKEIDIPACIILGERSPELSVGISEKLSESIPGATLCKVDGNHMSPLTNPGIVNPIIEKFIESNK